MTYAFALKSLPHLMFTMFWWFIIIATTTNPLVRNEILRNGSSNFSPARYTARQSSNIARFPLSSQSSYPRSTSFHYNLSPRPTTSILGGTPIECQLCVAYHHTARNLPQRRAMPIYLYHSFTGLHIQAT